VGSGERGRSMFESCLRNYPARLDVWSQYLDQVSSLHVQSLRPVEIHCNFVCLLRMFGKSMSNIIMLILVGQNALLPIMCKEALPVAWILCLQRAKTKSGLECLHPC